jgi:DNA mismatch repair protein MutS
MTVSSTPSDVRHAYGCTHSSQANAETATPMVRQFLAVKAQHPGVLLMYQMGDFYETFFEDALIANRVLDITLTARDAGGLGKIPMAGIPIKAADSYLPKLLAAQLKVAICQQQTDPAESKGLVERAVVRVLSSGTLTDGPMLATDAHNRLLALVPHPKHPDTIGLAWCEVSTGKMAVASCHKTQLADELERLQPAEVLVPGQPQHDKTTGVLACVPLATVPPLPAEWQPSPEVAPSHPDRLLCEVLRITHLDSTGLTANDVETLAAGLLAHSLKLRFPMAVPPFDGLQRVVPNHTVMLPATTRRNLELFETVRHRQTEGSLFGVLNQCQTGMGARCLRDWLGQPLRHPFELDARHDSVQWFVNHAAPLVTVRQQLATVQDVERLAQKVAQGTILPREMLALAHTLQQCVAISQGLEAGDPVDPAAFYVLRMAALPQGLTELASHIVAQLAPNPPIGLKEGGLFNTHAHPDLAALQDQVAQQLDWITQYEATERERTGLRSLKVQANGAFGYYIELPKAQARQAPEEYTRKQTLTNAERFITPALRAAEQTLQEAQNRLIALEFELFLQLRLYLLPHAAMLKDVAQRLACLDVVASFAHTAVQWQYCRPTWQPTPGMQLVQARHPVLEQRLPMGQFVANHCVMGTPEDPAHILMITGPNMAGKSTYMRTVALVALMAHIGSFVPATQATLGRIDAIYTRVGAVDDLTTGQSTFMVEMQETAAILHHATPNSLVLLDEVGRGTSTYDGVSIAWAVVEHLAQHNRSCTLFATHYHELNALEPRWPQQIRNLRVCVAETEDGIAFLHRVEPGTAQKSYGLHVARMAGLPKAVVLRADGLLNQLQRRAASLQGKSSGIAPADVDSPQLSFF